MKDVNYQQGEKVTLYCLLGNLFLSVFKGIVGFLGGSKAMVADAFHSASDVLATLVVYICIRIAKKPADQCHMYGHGKIEPLAAAAVGFIMIITAYLIARNIILSLIAGEFIIPSVIALLGAVASIILKEIMFRVTYNVGTRLNSQSITANAWEHRADCYSSLGTLVGISGSILGGYLNVGWLKYFDPLAGVLVSLLIFKMAVHILYQALQGLMDASPEDEKVAEIKEITEGVAGVRAVSWIKGRYLGRHIVVDMAVEVDGEKTVEEGHHISSSIKQEVMNSLEEVGSVLVHINPHEELEENHMKIGIIVYSQTGNTPVVAEKLKEKLDGGGHEVQIEKVTTVGEVKPGEKNIQFDNIPEIVNYEGLVFASPVHAFSLASAMQSYLEQLPSLGGHKVACFVTKQLPFHWTGGTRAVAQMKKICEAKDATVSDTAVVVWAKGKRDQSIKEAVEKLSKVFK